MLIVTSNDSSGEETGCMGNRPEERKRMVKAALEEAGFRSVVVSTPDVDLALAECVHSKELLSFLEHAWSNWSSLWIASKNNRGYLVPYGVTQKDSDEPPGLVPCYVAPRDGLQRASKTVIGGFSSISFFFFFSVLFFFPAIAMFGLDRETPITHLTYSQLCLDMAILRNCIDHVCSGAQPSVLYAQVTRKTNQSGG
jgi:acetoin utilization deacetylase AcuC-like enzyme